MPKVQFVLEFTGHQYVKVDEDGAFVRPATADQIARAIVEDFNHRFEQADSKLRVTIKPFKGSH